MLMQCDASGLEVRVAAYLSQDKVLIQEIIDGVDTHRDNQIRFKFPGWDIEDKSDDLYALGRLKAKVFVFRSIYGGNEFSFASDPDFMVISKSKEYWKTIIDEFYAKYRGLERWHQNLIREAVTTGYVVSPTGRRYKFDKYDGKVKDTQVKNYPVQGTGADIMALSRVSFNNRLKKLNLSDCLLVNTIHDSIVLDFDETKCDYEVLSEMFHSVFDDLPKNFEKMFGVKFNVPMACEVQMGVDLSKMKVIKRK